MITPITSLHKFHALRSAVQNVPKFHAMRCSGRNVPLRTFPPFVPHIGNWGLQLCDRPTITITIIFLNNTIIITIAIIFTINSITPQAQRAMLFNNWSGSLGSWWNVILVLTTSNLRNQLKIVKLATICLFVQHQRCIRQIGPNLLTNVHRKTGFEQRCLLLQFFL